MIWFLCDCLHLQYYYVVSISPSWKPRKQVTTSVSRRVHFEVHAGRVIEAPPGATSGQEMQAVTASTFCFNTRKVTAVNLRTAYMKWNPWNS